MARDDTALSILFSLLASPSTDMWNHAAMPTAWDDAVPFLAQVTSDEHKWVTSAKRRRRESSSMGFETIRPAAIASSSLLSSTAVVRSRCVGADGDASAFSVLVPVEIVGAFRVLFLPVIHHHPIRLDAAVKTDDDRAVALALRGVDTLGDIHLHGKTPGKVVSLLVSPLSDSVKGIDKEEG
jgi:hypothetical protein